MMLARQLKNFCLCYLIGILISPVYAQSLLRDDLVTNEHGDVFVVLRMLGEGGLSEVYLVRRKNDEARDRVYVLKLYELEQEDTTSEAKNSQKTIPFQTMPLDDSSQSSRFAETSPFVSEDAKQKIPEDFADRLTGAYRRAEDFLQKTQLIIYFSPIFGAGKYRHMHNQSRRFVGYYMPYDPSLSLDQARLIKSLTLNSSDLRDSRFNVFTRLKILRKILDNLIRINIAAAREKVVLGDIKPSNIVIKEVYDGYIEGIQEDLSRFLVEGGYIQYRDFDTLVPSGSWPVAFTPEYAAPELSSSKPILTSAADFYSTGLVILTLILGKHPQEEYRLGSWTKLQKNYSGLVRFIKGNLNRFRYFTRQNEADYQYLVNFILSALHPNPKKRMQLLNRHGYVDASIIQTNENWLMHSCKKFFSENLGKFLSGS